MMRRPSGGKKERQSVLAVVGFLVLIALFAVAYKLGERREQPKPGHGAEAKEGAAKTLSKSLQRCRQEIETKLREEEEMSSQSKSYSSHPDVDFLEADAVIARTRSEDSLKQLKSCKEELKVKQHMRDVQEKLDMQEIKSLEDELAILKEQVGRVGTKGQARIILEKNIGILANEHKRNLAILGRPSKVVSNVYLDELMEKWSAVPGGKLTEQSGNILRPNKTEIIWKYKKPQKGILTEKESSIQYFRATIDEAKSTAGSTVWTKPTWRGIVGNRNLTKGVVFGQKPSTNTIATLISELYEYTLCAAALNVTELAFPTRFDLPDGTRDYVRKYLITPYVSFCKDCTYHHLTNAFRLLCQGYEADDQYGTNLFWQMRSRLVVSDKIRNSAAQFIADEGLTGKVLAVRLPKSTTFVNMCQLLTHESANPLRFFAILGSVSVISREVRDQCDPPRETVAETIKKTAESLGAEKVYLSTELKADNELDSLIKSIDLPVVLAPGPDSENAAETASFFSLLDIVVASQMSGLVANRYDVASARMVEEFLLANKLSHSKLKIW